MRRWNGWGDDTVTYPLPDTAARFIEQAVGKGLPPHDASLESLLASVSNTASRLPAHPLVSTSPLERLKHSRGQSLPDLIAMRSGRHLVFPDGVAFPATAEEVRELLRFAHETGAKIIPYGGGTSVVGHINPLPGAAPALTVDLSHLSQLQSFDSKSQLATFGAGVAGPDLEAQLRVQGYTLGHFPQSFELSTLGGWVATRSSGQQSIRYGKIERLFAGGKLETPSGRLELPAFPATSAATDLREIVLGSEGHLGIITEATVRVSPLPEREEFYGVFFPGFEQGQSAARQIVQAGVPLSLLRLSTAQETRTTLALGGHQKAISYIQKLLAARGAGEDKALLVFGASGTEALSKMALKEAFHLIYRHGGVNLGPLNREFGRQWRKSRFRTPYLRNTAWEMGYGVDTLETATNWSNVETMIAAIENALRGAMEKIGERLLVFTHLSHLYPQGSSIYTTYLFRLAPDPDETLERWKLLKAAASAAIVECGGTISHQHGVGLDHAPYLVAEKGQQGIAAIRALYRHFDPAGMLNPGKTIVDEGPDYVG